MEKMLKYLAEQNQFFDPNDSLSKMVSQILERVQDELEEDDLFFVQAARGETYRRRPADQRKETDLT